MTAVIFDCDGTLVDSEVLASEVMVEAAAEQGLRLSLQEADVFRGGKMAESVLQLETMLGRRLPDDFVPAFRARLADTFRARLRPIEGALELVRSLSGPFCVASSGPRDKIELTLSLTGLLTYFKERIFSSYEVGIWKPEPGLFLHAARVMGVDASDCVVVEDSLPGIRAGLAAGMTVFAFQPHGVDERIPGEVRVITRLLELRDVLAVTRDHE